MPWLAAAILLAVPTTEPASRPVDDPWPSAQRYIYFPPQLFEQMRDIRGRSCVVWTNAARLDDDALRSLLDAACDYLAALPLRPGLFAATQQATGPATVPAEPIVVAALYETQEQFRALWPRVGVYYGGRFLGLAEAGGYSYRVFCATYVDAAAPQAGPPELLHEMAHVWLWRRADVPNDGNWLTEALASAVQYRFAPASADRPAWARRLDEGKYVPLKRLMATKPVRPDQYWQVGTLGELLLTAYRDRLPAVIQAVRDGRDVNAIVTESLGTDWLDLERQWAEHVRAGQ